MANHLIIGLGGTGGKVLREIRKRVYEEFRSNNPTGNINLGYIYVDSSPADLNDRTGWKALGKPVHLSEAQKVSIHGISATMFQNLQMYPGINGFLTPDDVHLMTSRLGPLVTAGIGGQRRRLGRTLLANNMSVADENNFAKRLGFAVNNLTNASGDADVTFHVCAGLAGGTGSGSVVDVVSQIRKQFPPVEGGLKYQLLLYLYVPEMNVVYHNHDSGFYQANGYAALLELNAMSVRKYHPIDISGQKDSFTGQVKRLLDGQNAFDAAYLYSNINESGKILDITKALPTAVADFLFQKVVAPSMTDPTSTHETGQMARLMGCENDGAGDEYNQANQPTRSRKFMGFGIKRVEYPETEIEEYVTYNFARQAALQLQFNNWQEGIGYGECSIEEAGIGLSSEVEDKKNYPKWLLSVSHLTLSTPIIETPQSKRWMDLTKTWESRTQMFADDAQTNADKKSWLRLFSDDSRDYFDKNFRALGVKKFYELQRQERVGYAKFIRNHIETMLFNEWRSGERSLLNIEIFTKLLIANCERRITEFKERTATKHDEMEAANAAIKAANVEWDNIGWLRDAITGASKKVLSAYKTATCDFYTAATWVEAYGFATALLQSVIEQLTNMADGVNAYRHMLNEILEEVTRQAGSKCRKEENADDGMTLKKYDHDLVESFTKSCVVNQDTQRSNAGAIRQKLVEMLGEEGDRSFAALLKHADFDTTVDVIVEMCQRNADSAMINTAAEDATRKMVGVNILEKIKQEYNTDEKLQSFVKSLVDSAKTFLQFNQKQIGMVFANAGGGMQSMIQLCLPEYPDDTTGFRQKLIDAFAAAAPGFIPKQDVAINPKPNQIVVVAAKAGFPLRYLTNVEVLKNKYEEMLHAQDKELNKMVLHTESFDKELPSLFEMGTEEVKRMIEKPVLLAYALGLIERKSDPTTGQKFDAMKVKDAFGDKWERIGSDILSVTDTIAKNFTQATALKNEVEKEMKTAARSNDQKAALRQKLVDIVQTVILPHPEVENNEFSPIYKKYRELCIQLFENELKDL